MTVEHRETTVLRAYACPTRKGRLVDEDGNLMAGVAAALTFLCLALAPLIGFALMMLLDVALG